MCGQACLFVRVCLYLCVSKVEHTVRYGMHASSHMLERNALLTVATTMLRAMFTEIW